MGFHGLPLRVDSDWDPRREDSEEVEGQLHLVLETASGHTRTDLQVKELVSGYSALELTWRAVKGCGDDTVTPTYTTAEHSELTGPGEPTE